MLDKLIHRWLRVPYTLHVHTHRKPKQSRAIVVFLHGIGNSGAVWENITTKLPDDVTVITIDLLGFGQSPRPEWAVYSVVTQARSVVATLIRLRLTGRIILVGHSLGSLVSVEVARSYPVIVRSLVLCSPPFYNPATDKNRLLQAVFRGIQRRPEQFIRLAGIASKYNLINKSFAVTPETIQPYIRTLRASILTQTSLHDAITLKKPLTLLFGTLDPWVKRKNLVLITRQNEFATLRTVVAGHEIKGSFVPAVVSAVNSHIEAYRTSTREKGGSAR